jgi:hypothetical protein
LVCRAFMNYGDHGSKVLGLITLGTPHHGTPLAVPDWCAELWKRRGQAIFTFNSLVGPRKSGLDTTQLGQLNLAWDNMDGAVTTRQKFQFDAEIASGGYMQLTPGDLNTLEGWSRDVSQFYSEADKRAYGTLAELNRNERFFERIVAFGACMGLDPTSTDFALGAIYVEKKLHLPSLVGKGKAFEHDGLIAFAKCLGDIDWGCTDRETNYVANDGLVPLQSALFLDISHGDRFAECIKGGVRIDQARIGLRNQVKKQQLLNMSHLDLVDTDNYEYCSAVIREIQAFASGQ